MLDQNTTTIIASIIAVLGTLGGAITGVILSNRHTTKMEHLKIKQEKLKRNNAIIQEAYTLLLNINDQIEDNINNKRHCKDGIGDKVNRIQTLICLYFPSLIEKFAKLDDSLTQLSVEVNGAQQANNPSDIRKNVSGTYQNWRQKLLEVESALEKLVR